MVLQILPTSSKYLISTYCQIFLQVVENHPAFSWYASVFISTYYSKNVINNNGKLGRYTNGCHVGGKYTAIA